LYDGIGLKEMGFESKMIVEGLKQTDNDEEKTLQLLLQHPELLNPRIDELQSDVMKNLFIPKPEEVHCFFSSLLIILLLLLLYY
jgi:hypothetical protein